MVDLITALLTPWRPLRVVIITILSFGGAVHVLIYRSGRDPCDR
jgi:hypothetical protein